MRMRVPRWYYFEAQNPFKWSGFNIEYARETSRKNVKKYLLVTAQQWMYEKKNYEEISAREDKQTKLTHASGNEFFNRENFRKKI